MTTHDVKLGDRVRLTWQESGAVITAEGLAIGQPDHPRVGPFYVYNESRTVEVLERALPPEPPIGSIVAVPGCVPGMRHTDGRWWRPSLDAQRRSWADVWTSDLVVLREGWGT